jgi:hypothetical protein
MSYSRLFLVALWLCSLPAFAQNHSLMGSNVQEVPDFRTPPAATPSEPWRILPKPDSDKDKGLILITPELRPQGIIVSPDGPLVAGTTCYVIRSYVVARDSKDSDSVHPIGYLTCIPATRYRLKTAEETSPGERGQAAHEP